MAHTDVAELSTKGAERLYFLANLRSFIILLVVVLHAGVVFESSGFGGMFWLVDDPATSDIVDLFNMVFDIFLMPTLFFISGFLTPRSLDRKGAADFLAGKARRLMLPWLVAILVLMPLYKVIFLATRGLPQQDWTTYFHFNNGIFSQSWLWFLPVLFLFNVLYVLLWLGDWIPRNASVARAVMFVFVVGFGMSFGMEYFGLQGWTKTMLLDFQNERVLLYFMIFMAGSLGYHQRLFASPPRGLKWYIAVNMVAWLPLMAYLLFLILPYVAPGKYIVSPVGDRLLMWFFFYLSLLTLLYLSFETFRRYFNRQGRIWRELDRNSYYVYIIHVIVLGLIGWSMLDLDLAWWQKYVTLSLSTWVASNVIISLWRWVKHVGSSWTAPNLIRTHHVMRGSGS